MAKITNAKTRTTRAALLLAAMLVFALLFTACGGGNPNAAAMAEKVYTPPMEGAMYAGTVAEGATVMLREYTLYHDGLDAGVITAHLVHNVAGSGSPFFLAKGQTEKVYPYWIENQDGELIVWLMPVCEQYDFSIDGDPRTLRMFEGEMITDLDLDPYTVIKAACTDGKVAILDISLSQDCLVDSIIWDEEGRWSCKSSVNGLPMRGDPPPNDAWMWPQGTP